MGVQRVGSVEDLVPETIEQVAVAAVVALAVVDQAAAAAVVAVAAAAMEAAEDLEVVAMEAASTTVMDMEETITPRGLTGGATESACSRYPTKQANMETTCNLARLYLV